MTKRKGIKPKPKADLDIDAVLSSGSANLSSEKCPSTQGSSIGPYSKNVLEKAAFRERAFAYWSSGGCSNNNSASGQR